MKALVPRVCRCIPRLLGSRVSIWATGSWAVGSWATGGRAVHSRSFHSSEAASQDKLRVIRKDSVGKVAARVATEDSSKTISAGQTISDDQPTSADQPTSEYVMNLLEKPQSEDLDSEITERVNSLEKFIEVGKMQMDSVSSGLEYVLDNFSSTSSKNLTQSQRKLLNQLLHSRPQEIRTLIRRARSSVDLVIILSHLVFREQLDASALASIVVRLDLERLLTVHQRLSTGPRIVQGWFTDPEVQMKCEIAIASRYKMLGSRTLAKFIIDNSLEQTWLPKIKSGAFGSSVYLRNMVQLLKGIVGEPELYALVMETENPQLSFILWEAYPTNSDVKDYLRSISDSLNDIQQVVVEFMNNPLVSTNREYTLKLSRISEHLKLCTGKNVSARRFIGSLEVFLTNLKDSIEINSENRDFFEEMVTALDQFRVQTNQSKEEYVVGIDVGLAKH
ncbi:DEKNAAC103094 [Brettanomyces naardenensis]|uniref:DEKNAAC103094 n=1 Tax=Brettanomyces naardenensis TaxID=13370 RepID=A0A448YMB2_BRENA|nr:DEKNAAC103094 [Brettanomyces naardenensis]